MWHFHKSQNEWCRLVGISFQQFALTWHGLLNCLFNEQCGTGYTKFGAIGFIGGSRQSTNICFGYNTGSIFTYCDALFSRSPLLNWWYGATVKLARPAIKYWNGNRANETSVFKYYCRLASVYRSVVVPTHLKQLSTQTARTRTRTHEHTIIDLLYKTYSSWYC